MGCSCGIATDQRSIDPGDSCLYCAEKHLSVCMTVLSSLGLKPGSRQIVIGELELARRHTAEAYKQLSDLIAEALQRTIWREDAAVKDSVSAALDMCDGLVEQLAYDSDTKKPVYSYTASTYGYNPLAGELYLCCGYRLASEQGYERANRRTLLGELTAAQYHLTQLDQQLGTLIWDIRKRIESYKQVSSAEWLNLMIDADTVVTEALAQGASKDLSWYIRR